MLQAKAQQTLVHSDKYKDYKIAQELFDKGKFSSSQAYFKQIIDEVTEKQDEVRINSEYYFERFLEYHICFVGTGFKFLINNFKFSRSFLRF